MEDQWKKIEDVLTVGFFDQPMYGLLKVEGEGWLWFEEIDQVNVLDGPEEDPLVDCVDAVRVYSLWVMDEGWTRVALNRSLKEKYELSLEEQLLDKTYLSGRNPFWDAYRKTGKRAFRGWTVTGFREAKLNWYYSWGA